MTSSNGDEMACRTPTRLVSSSLPLYTTVPSEFMFPQTLTGFLSTCIEAGPKYCAFAAPNDGSNKTETVKTLRRRLNALYSRFGDQPLTVADSRAGPGILKASDLQFAIFNILYTPESWRNMARRQYR
jgi:hypothetical protein